MKIRLNDKEVTINEVNELLSMIDRENVIAFEINGKMSELSSDIHESDDIRTVEYGSKKGMHVFWHTSAHIMAHALQRTFPSVKLTIGPAVDNGFYYDIDLEKRLNEDDFALIEAEYQKIVKEGLEIKRRELTRKDLIEMYEKQNNEFKVELLNEITDEMVSIYEQGDFFDLCRGPHLINTSQAPVFKVLSIAGAYWRADDKNKMLQRVYGVSFRTQKELQDYIDLYKEAEERDHRKLGKELELFAIYPEAGVGLIYWKPRGAYLKNKIEEMWKNEHLKAGYELISSPHVAKRNLWEISGHYEFYKENLYPDMIFAEGENYLIKPMNCPFHIMIFKENLKSYKELPIRFAELGTVYRYEKSGVLHGLLRVRGFTVDDAHIFCRKEDLEKEVRGLLDFSVFFIKKFGFTDFKVYLATKPDKFVGEAQNWDKAENTLREAVENYGIEYELDAGGGAFYGPKIDIKIKDLLGREWQTTTIQFDFNLPDRFDLNFINEKGEKERPIMIHRAILGSLERFIGVLIEHYKGDFPLWLSYDHVTIIPVTEKNNDYALEIKNELTENGIRANMDLRNERVGYKIRDVRLKKIPYFMVVGPNEQNNKTVKPTGRKEGEIGEIKLTDFIDILKKRLKEEV